MAEEVPTTETWLGRQWKGLVGLGFACVRRTCDMHERAWGRGGLMVEPAGLTSTKTLTALCKISTSSLLSRPLRSTHCFLSTTTITASPSNSDHQRRHQSHSTHHPSIDPNPHPARRRIRRGCRARRIGRRRPRLRRCRRPRHSGARGRGAPALDLITRQKPIVRRPRMRHRAHILALAAPRLDHDPIRARGTCATFSPCPHTAHWNKKGDSRPA